MTQLCKQIQDEMLKYRAQVQSDNVCVHKFEISIIKQMVSFIKPLCAELQKQCKLRAKQEGKTQKQIQSFVKKQIDSFTQRFVEQIYGVILQHLKRYKFNYEGVVDINLKQNVDNYTVVISQNSTCNMLMIKLIKVFEAKTPPHYKISTSY